jgi:hypothetical protein
MVGEFFPFTGNCLLTRYDPKVPQPTPYTAPLDAKLVFDPQAKTEPSGLIEPLPFIRNSSGRIWKQPRSASVRSGKLPAEKKASSWSKRQEVRKKDESVKKLER